MREDRSQNSSRHIVEPGFGDFAVGDRLRQRRAEEVLRIELLAGFLIQPRHRRANRRVDRAPVGHDEIGIAPVRLEHLIEEPVVFASVASVHLVVGAHHAARAPALDGDLEGEQVRFAHRGRIDSRVEDDPVGFLRIEREVLDRRDDVAALHALDHAARHHAGEQRILGEILEIAAAARVANEICRAAKKDIEALRARFGADCLALKPRKRLVPGRGEGEIGRHRGRGVAGTDVAWVGDAKLCVRLLQRGNAEARYAGHVARRADRSGRFGLAAPRRRDDAMDEATASPAPSSARAPFARAEREAGRRSFHGQSRCGRRIAD